MQDEHIVRDLHVTDGERSIKASYFVEAGVIHAHFDGRTLMLPVGSDNTQDAVRRLLLGHLKIEGWRERFASKTLDKD